MIDWTVASVARTVAVARLMFSGHLLTFSVVMSHPENDVVCVAGQECTSSPQPVAHFELPLTSLLLGSRYRRS